MLALVIWSFIAVLWACGYVSLASVAMYCIAGFIGQALAQWLMPYAPPSRPATIDTPSAPLDPIRYYSLYSLADEPPWTLHASTLAEEYVLLSRPATIDARRH